MRAIFSCKNSHSMMFCVCCACIITARSTNQKKPRLLSATWKCGSWGGGNTCNKDSTYNATLVTRQVAQKCCPYYLAFKQRRKFSRRYLTEEAWDSSGQPQLRVDSHREDARVCSSFKKKLVFILSLLTGINCGYNHFKLKGPIFSGIKDFAKLLERRVFIFICR